MNNPLSRDRVREASKIGTLTKNPTVVDHLPTADVREIKIVTPPNMLVTIIAKLLEYRKVMKVSFAYFGVWFNAWFSF